jgi:UPF0755 protein
MNKKRRKFPRILLLIFLILLLVLCGAAYNFISGIPLTAERLFGPPSAHMNVWQHYTTAYRLIQNQEHLLTPVNPNQETQRFTIELDEPTSSIIARLEGAGLIADQSSFRDYLVYSGIDTQLQAGDFYLWGGMSAVEIAQSLLDSTPLFITVSILPGWRMEEIAASLPSTGLSITPEEFIQAASQRYNALNIMQEVPLGVHLEGLFPPGSYEVERTLDAEQLVRFLLEERDSSINREIRTGLDQQGLTLYEGLILASIVQREAVVPEEMPLIASVFLNRLVISMKLETDPTIQYAVGYNAAQNSWWTNPLTRADLEVVSPYNTYINPGLPPTPIANPGIPALQAVAYPAQTPYYYFRATCDGSGRHNFSETFQEHLDKACP